MYTAIIKLCSINLLECCPYPVAFSWRLNDDVQAHQAHLPSQLNGMAVGIPIDHSRNSRIKSGRKSVVGRQFAPCGLYFHRTVWKFQFFCRSISIQVLSKEVLVAEYEVVFRFIYAKFI